MSETKRKSRRETYLIFPKSEWVDEHRARLPSFKPLDLRRLISEAKRRMKDKYKIDEEAIVAHRRHIDEQIADLLSSLGYTKRTDDVWKRAFYTLAILDYGVGHTVYNRPRHNRNAAKWTVDHDLVFLERMESLKKAGLSERKAIKQLASDPAFVQGLPYSEHRQKETSRTKSKSLLALERALRMRYRHLKIHYSYENWAERIIGGPLPGSRLEFSLWRLDMQELGPPELAKNETPENRADS